MIGSGVDVPNLVAKHGPLKLLFFGPPGVGKGTFAGLLTKKWALPHVSTGDMIRAEIKGQTKLGLQFKEFNDKGVLVPDEVVCAIAQKRLEQPDAKNGYVLDGFPRTIAQAELLENFAPSSLCLNLMLPEKFLIMKLSGRRVCTKCGKNFNVADIKEGPYNMPPLLPLPDGHCDKCGSRDIVQRDDDKLDVVVKRLEVYRKETAPLIDFYIKRGILRTFPVMKGIQDYGQVEKIIRTSLEDIGMLRNLR